MDITSSTYVRKGDCMCLLILQRAHSPERWKAPIYVTLHGVSGNKVNARIRHVITRSHANGMTRLPCRNAYENKRFWQACS